MANKLPKFNKKTADPVILRQYEDLRNTRRYRYAVLFGDLARLIALPLVFLIAWWHPLSDNGTALLVLGILAAFILSMAWMMIRWAPHGKRLLAFKIFLGIVAFAAISMGILTWLQVYGWNIP